MTAAVQGGPSVAQTFYDILGVSPDATTEEINTAYRERIKETHPDVSDAEDAQEQAKRVIEAKETLVDEDERARYDRLGHRAYVTEMSVDGDWDVSTAGPDPTVKESDSDDEGGNGTGRSRPGPGTGAESVYEGTWATNGVSESESESADSESESESTDSESATATSSETDSGTSTGTANAADSAAQRGESGDPDPNRKRKRRSRTRGANATTNVGDAVGWASGVDGRHAVRQESEEQGFKREFLLPTSHSPVLLLSSFITYPAMVFSTFFPPFTLVVNLFIGLLTLLLIAYLMSIPEVGLYVFGIWSVLATFGAIAGGVSPLSIFGLILFGSTWLPLLLTVATYKILNW